MIDAFISIVLLAFGLGLAALPASRIRGGAAGGLALAAWHTAWCLVYWQYSLIASADATVYLAFGAVGEPTFLPGTRMVQALSVVLVRYLGLGALNAFLVFNLAGVLGLLMLRRALWELTEGLPGRSTRLVRLLVWLPGLSFWSAAPGKDGLAFLGVCLAVYAAVDLRPRWPWLLAGLASMFLVRPHMAVVLLVAAAFAHFTGSRRRGAGGLLLSVVLAGAAVVVVPYALEYAGLGGAQEVEDLTSYVEKRQSTNLGGNSSVDISAMSPWERLFTFMFRPLFVDATSVTGLVASAESLLLLVFAVAGGIVGWRCRPRPAGFTFRFSLAYLLAGWLLLANVTANLGIAVRQKTMLVPALLAVGAMAFTGLARQRRRRSAPPLRQEPAALAPSAAGP